jgi:hypothetical protein
VANIIDLPFNHDLNIHVPKSEEKYKVKQQKQEVSLLKKDA